MQITAAMVKTLRERTGAGMMECKKALVEAGGDIDLGADNLRKAGQAKADKKASRVAVEGTIAIVQEATKALIIEVNCETDFVSSNQDYTDFAKTIAGYALSADCDDPEAVLSLNSPDGVTVEEMRRNLITAVGENVQIRRLNLVKSAGNHLGVYLHGGRIGVIVDVRGGDEELAKDIAMHIAASRPAALDADHLPAEQLDKEREIIRAQVAASGKAPEIQEKMIPGMVNKYLKEVTLLGQAFVKQPDLSVAKHLEANGAEVLSYQRFEVGEGLEIDSD
jgi:elongation factor Ts